MFGNEKYPDDWKIACLKYLREKRESLRRSVGHKRLGWGPIRDLIMQPYDTIVAGEIVVASDLLNESTLEAWHRRDDASITDGKFRFVDEYIRSLAIDRKDSSIVEMIRKQRFRDITNALFAAYNPKSLGGVADYDRSGLPKWCHESRLWELPGAKNCISIKFIGSHRGAFHIVCVFTPYFDSQTDLPDPRDMIFFEGVALPIGSEVFHEDSFGHVITHYLVKLFREEFSGISDLGYAEGDMQVSSLPDHNDETRIDLYEVTSWFRPRTVFPIDPRWVDESSKDKRRILDMDSDLKRAIRRKNEDRGRYGYVNTLMKESEKLDFIFDNYYEGYL